MINNIKYISYNSYPFLSKYVPIISGLSNKKLLYNRFISNNWRDLNEKSFEGRLACGASCYLLHYVLRDKGIPTKMMYKSIGYGKYLEDHCYLLYRDKIIIDPTYRQFFSQMINEKNDFSKLLFNKYPFVFVGNIQEFQNRYSYLNSLHNNTFNSFLEISVSDFWENTKESNALMDASEVLNDYNYAQEKGTIFLELHKKYNRDVDQ